jgi:hypothetical protein
VSLETLRKVQSRTGNDKTRDSVAEGGAGGAREPAKNAETIPAAIQFSDEPARDSREAPMKPEIRGTFGHVTASHASPQ